VKSGIIPEGGIPPTDSKIQSLKSHARSWLFLFTYLSVCFMATRGVLVLFFFLCDVGWQRRVCVYVVYLGLCVVFDRYQRRISGEKL